MNRKLLLLSICSILVTAIISCGDYPCAKAEFRFHLVGFSDAEADTIVMRRLQLNSSLIVDSFVFDPSNRIVFSRSGDTLSPAIAPGTTILRSAYDYQFYFPGAERTIHITDMHEEQQYGRKSTKKTYCMNSIDACKVDGAPGVFFRFDGIILKK